MKKFLALFIFTLSFNVSAQLQPLVSSGEDFHYANFYKIKIDPRATQVDLLNFETVNESFPQPAERYNRQQHFGGWLQDTNSGSCLNTRGKVLVRDSKTTPSFSNNGCTVYSGQWDEPYTGRLRTQARDIQIDHMVPLKNAYMTGAHEWDFNKRCLYANFMGNRMHLISADGPENLKKGDQTPAGYVPPNQTYICQYVKNWLNIKAIWDLRVTPPEGEAVRRITDQYSCPHEMFIVSMQSLDEQHRFMQENANLCSTPSAVLTAFQ